MTRIQDTDFRNFVLAHAARVAFYSFWGMFGLVCFMLLAVQVFDLWNGRVDSIDYLSIIPLGIFAGLAWMALGGVVSLGIRVRAWEDFKMEQFELAHANLKNGKPDTPTPPHTRPKSSREIAIKTIRGTAVIVQPRAAAFTTWLNDVLNPDTKVTFSKNEAKRREWEDWQYVNLVAQLKGIGWLHPQRNFNGAPDLDGRHVEEIRTWLKTPLL